MVEECCPDQEHEEPYAVHLRRQQVLMPHRFTSASTGRKQQQT